MVLQIKIKMVLPSEEEMISGHPKWQVVLQTFSLELIIFEACCLLSGLTFGISLLPRRGFGIHSCLGGSVSLLHILLTSVSLLSPYSKGVTSHAFSFPVAKHLICVPGQLSRKPHSAYPIRNADLC